MAETRKLGVAPKLERLYEGPFVIREKISEINFMLQLDSDGRKRLVHHVKLNRYEGNSQPNWAAKVRLKIQKQQEKKD